MSESGLELKLKEFWQENIEFSKENIELKKENEKLQARLLEYEGKTYSENEEIKKLKADAFEDTKKLYAQSQEIEKLKAELKQHSELNRKLANHNADKTELITKLTHQRDTLKKCAEFYAKEVQTDGKEEFYADHPLGWEARKALQDVEESENEKA